MGDPETDVTVIIPTNQQALRLPMALAHLEVQSFPSARFEVFIAEYGKEAPNSGAETSVLQRYCTGAPMRVRHIFGYANRAQACNAALEEARGRTVLFLDEDVLASPTLVEAHAELHANSTEPKAVVGRIEFHPQTDPRAFTYPKETDSLARYRIESDTGYIDWRLLHVSYPMAYFQQAGFFDESPALAGLEDVELGWRMMQAGVRGHFADDIFALTWRTSSIKRERNRAYLEGYALHALEDRTGIANLLPRIAGESIQPYFLRAMYVPLSTLISPLLAANTRLYQSLLHGIMYYDMQHGYRDARSGLMPEPPTLKPINLV